MKKNVTEKDFMNQDEAAAFYNLSRRKFFRLLATKEAAQFFAFYGQRKLIIRVEFEKYRRKNPQIKEALKNGKPRKREA